MNFQSVNKVQVYYVGGKVKQPVGQLALKDRKLFFEYDADFLKTGIELSPFQLPLKPGPIGSKETVFDGLWGVFNDSLPDGWGRLLLDRKLIAMGVNPGALTPLDRLCYVGIHGMGALTFEPAVKSSIVKQHVHLDSMAVDIFRFQENEVEDCVDELIYLNGSSAGARPKIVVQLLDHDTERIKDNTLEETNNWIIKFPSSMDPKDIGAIEYAYHLMAKSAGIEVPEAKLFSSKHCAGYFGVKRFDCVNKKRIHMHTLSGLLHADHRLPSVDYESLLQATLYLTKDTKSIEKQFRRAVFNLMAHNRDDHGKNFAFLMDEKGMWRVSPAYDLTFSSGPSGEHCTMVMGEGKNPTLEHVLRLAKVNSIEQKVALTMVEEVKGAIMQWKQFATSVGVNEKTKTMIQKVLGLLSKNF